MTQAVSNVYHSVAVYETGSNPSTTACGTSDEDDASSEGIKITLSVSTRD